MQSFAARRPQNAASASAAGSPARVTTLRWCAGSSSWAYNAEDHGLRQRKNQRDWTRRMQEYFDHHLKGAPAPEWMRRGVPYHERMAEKIPHAPSYREAIDAGLIRPAEATASRPAEATAPTEEPTAEPATTERPVGAPGGR
jgi:hypothetical protein